MAKKIQFWGVYVGHRETMQQWFLGLSRESPNGNLTDTLYELLLTNAFIDVIAALSNATMAKMLHNHHGYDPYQLVFGLNWSIPYNLTDKRPTIKTKRKSKIVAKHFEDKAARKAFSGAESRLIAV